MLKNENVNIPSFYGEMTESIFMEDSKVSVDSSNYRVQVTQFQPIKRCVSRDFSDDSQDQMVSRESLNRMSLQANSQTYKCYKCFTENGRDGIQYYPHKCRECSGTSYISQSHPLVNLLDELLKKKLPSLFSKPEEHKRINRKQTLQFDYRCPEVIREESFSYQEEVIPTCQSCNKECFTDNYRFCKQCSDFFLCKNCYSRKRYDHPHELSSKDKNSHNISEQLPFQQNDSGQYTLKQEQMVWPHDDFDLKCNNCQQKVETCYEACLTCESLGIRYVVCANCSEKQLYSHNSDHELAMKTMMHAQQLSKLSPHYSYDLWDITLKQNSMTNLVELQVSDKSDNHHSYNQSVINIQEGEINDQQQSIRQNSVISEFIPMNGLHGVSLTNSKLVDSFEHTIEHTSKRIIRKQSIPLTSSIQFSEIEQGLQQRLKPNLKGVVNASTLSRSMEYFNNQMFNVIVETREEDGCPSILDLVPENSVQQQQVLKTGFNPEDQFVFNDYQCDICHGLPIKNKRYHCKQCQNYDICQKCFLFETSKHEHRNYEEIDGLVIKQQRQSIIRANQLKVTRKQEEKNINVGNNRDIQ